MIDSKLNAATVVLLEKNREIRGLVKSALLGIGFGTVQECKSTDKARSLMATAKPDLLVLDLDLDNAAVCALIQDIRHSQIGNNPFVIIIGLTQNPDKPVIQCALDAGTDDLVRKPVSTQLLIERINNLIQNRKEFIATSDYVGPQRGKGVRPDDEEVAQVKVPNSLREKATGKKTATVDDREIERAAYTVTLQRVYSLVVDAIDIIDRLESAAAEGAGGGGMAEDIGQLSALVSQIKDVKLPDAIRNLSQLTASMDTVLAAVEQTSSPSIRQFALLRLHAQAIAATMRGDHNASDDVAAALGQVTAPASGDGEMAAND